MNLKNLFTLTIRTEDYNLVADRPGFLRELRELSFGPGAGMCHELDNFEKIRQERKVNAEIITAYRSGELVGWALLSKEKSSFCFERNYDGYSPEYGYLFEVFVDWGHRRQGIGSALLKAAQKRVGKEALCVCPHDNTSTNFFQKFSNINNKWM